jgi:acyl dehydratase
MAESSIISDELRDKIGAEWELGVYDIEKEMLHKFIRAIDDSSPLWQDEERARQRRSGGIIAPPTFILTIGGEQFGQAIAPMFPAGLLHGSTELESYQPVRPGDRITAAIKIAGIRERPSSKMAFVTFDLTYRNQRRKLVARCQQTMIGYEAKGAKDG